MVQKRICNSGIRHPYPFLRRLPAQLLPGNMEDRVRGGDDSHSNAHAFLQRRGWNTWSLWVLATNGLLPRRNVHLSEEDKKVVTQVDGASNAELHLPDCVSSRRGWLSRRRSTGFENL